MTMKQDWIVARARRRVKAVPDPQLDEVCDTMLATLDCDGAFVSFLTSGKKGRQYIVGEADMPAEALDPNGTPLGLSFCYRMLQGGVDGAVVDNTRDEPLLDLCPTTETWGAWVGAPVEWHGEKIGAVGVLATEPRRWPETALDVVRAGALRVQEKLG